MAGYNPDQPRDDKGQWTAGMVQMAHALSQLKVKIRNDPIAHGALSYSIVPGQPLPHKITPEMLAAKLSDLIEGAPGKGATLYAPNRALRAQAKKSDVQLGIGHEVGHMLSGHFRLRRAVPSEQVAIERQAWASGLRWLRAHGVRPSLKALRTNLSKTLATYGPRITPSRYNSHAKIMRGK